MQRLEGPQDAKQLPDWFAPVAQDVLRYCRPQEGLWVDLGSGSGALGLALAGKSRSTILLIDPDADALSKGFMSARSSNTHDRVVPIVGRAGSVPLPDGPVDLVASRGSIFFWDDPPSGLREVYRILRPGCRAIIGGGLGSSYPQWASKEFFRRRHAWLEAQGKQAVRKWNEPRRPEWLDGQARAAGLRGSLVDALPAGLWLLLEKEKP